MKATIIIFTSVLSFQASVLFAVNNETSSAINHHLDICTGTICLLAPVTPIEAAFEGETETTAYPFDVLFPTPVTPEEVDFSATDLENDIDLTIMAPVTPAEADFNDIIEDQVTGISFLAPVTPSEADFE
jgi:hypothetical protein